MIQIRIRLALEKKFCDARGLGRAREIYYGCKHSVSLRVRVVDAEKREKYRIK